MKHATIYLLEGFLTDFTSIMQEEEEEPSEKHSPGKAASSLKRTTSTKTISSKTSEKVAKKGTGKTTGKEGDDSAKRPSAKTAVKLTELKEKPAVPKQYDEDLKLRAALYGVLFQTFIDKVRYLLFLA